MLLENIQSSCLHEASHALVAWVRGLKIRELNIAEDRWSAGGTEDGSHLFCNIEGPAMLGVGQLHDKDVVDRVMIHLSPMAFSEELSGCGADADIDSAMRFLNFGSVSDPKARGLIDSARELAGDPDATARFFDRHKAMVEDIFKDEKIKASTTALAKHLSKVETMSGAEVIGFLEKHHGKPYPEKAIPLKDQPVLLKDDQSFEGAMATVSKLIRVARDVLNSARPGDDAEERAQEHMMEKLVDVQFSTG